MERIEREGEREKAHMLILFSYSCSPTSGFSVFVSFLKCVMYLLAPGRI
jgi:hypothetical protein